MQNSKSRTHCESGIRSPAAKGFKPSSGLFPSESGHLASFCSKFGEIRIVWIEGKSGPKIRRLYLPGNPPPVPLSSETIPAANASIEELVESILLFLDGQNLVFDPGILDWELCSPFQRRVLLAESAIPRGYVSSYRNIARHLGVPEGARAVGGALSSNPFPILIPCHRAIRSDGALGGFQGGPEMKRSLLEAEGIRFRTNGKVLLERIFYAEAERLHKGASKSKSC